MRKLTAHIVNECNDKLSIEVLDEPGQGGACHAYDIAGFDTASNAASRSGDGYRREFSRTPIVFQNGPIKEHGTNGVTHEALLAILIDRLEGFQSGQYANDMNQIALDSLRTAQRALQHRTRERLARGVEGTHAV